MVFPNTKLALSDSSSYTVLFRGDLGKARANEPVPEFPNMTRRVEARCPPHIGGILGVSETPRAQTLPGFPRGISSCPAFRPVLYLPTLCFPLLPRISATCFQETCTMSNERFQDSVPTGSYAIKGPDHPGQAIGRIDGAAARDTTLTYSLRGAAGFSPHAGSQQSPTSTISADTAQAASRKRARPEGSRAEATYPRKRAITACRLCRSRKVKCNNARPVCGNCEASKATCVYEDNHDISKLVPLSVSRVRWLMRMSRFDPASILILEKLEKVLSRLDQVQTTSPPSTHDTSLIAPNVTRHESSNGISCLDSQGQKSRGQDQDSDNCDFDQRSIPTARTTADAVLQWPVFGSCYPPNYIIDAAFVDNNLEEYHNDKRPQSGIVRSHNRGAVLEEDTVLELIRLFLDLVYPKNPILDVELLWSYTEDILESGLKWDSASCIVVGPRHNHADVTDC